MASAPEVDVPAQVEEQNVEVQEGAEQVPDQPQVFNLDILLPHAPNKISIMVTTQEQLQDIRQSVIESPDTYQYSCFHLEHHGKRINDYIELSEVPDLTPDSQIVLVEDPYTEREAKIHVLRIREVIGATAQKCDSVAGINAGISFFSDVQEAIEQADPKSTSHPMSDYDFEKSASFEIYIPPVQSPAPKTIKSISISPWNPPPYHLRQKGHLMYLQVVTLEGETVHITSHISGFYVNKCSGQKFDPSPKNAKGLHAHSLLNLLPQISPAFQKEFQALLEFNSKRDPLATFPPTNALPSSPWAVPPQTAPHYQQTWEISRTQDAYLNQNTENSDTLRDYNEEFQSTRELPKDTVQERVFRERLLSKMYADYTEAAVKGAMLIARGELAPLNPTEGKDAQIFVHNQIFFSHGADGVGTFAAEGGDEAARLATGKDVLGVKIVNTLDIHGLSTPGTAVIDYLGHRIVAQSIIPGIFRQKEDGQNQIDYGGVEGREVVATNEQFEPLFEKMSKSMHVKKHAVWDKEGKRHDLVSSVETKGLLGTDGRKYVLDLYRITPLDVEFLEKHWKGIEGEEAEQGYPHRMAVLRSELVDSFYRIKLREYVTAEATKKQAEKAAKLEAEKKEKEEKGEATEEKKEDATEEKKEGETAEEKKEGDATEEKKEGEATEEKAEEKKVEEDDFKVDISAFNLALNPDVFSGQKPQSEEEKAEMEKDEANVRAACAFLTGQIIPGLIDDLKEGDVGSPMDGYSLVRLMHKRGINVRYLGLIAEKAAEHGSKLESIRAIAVQEMIARSVKHVLNPLLRSVTLSIAPYVVSHFLNCLLGSEYNAEPKVVVDEELVKLYVNADLSFTELTPKIVAEKVQKDVFRRYRHTLPEDWVKSVKHVQLLREIALKVGLQIVARKYTFKPMSEEEKEKLKEIAALKAQANGQEQQQQQQGGKKGKKGGKKASAPSTPPVQKAVAPATTFTVEDIVNFVPIVKDAASKSQLAEEALEAGRISIIQDQRDLGQELLLESLSLHEQIYGVLHPEVARVYNTLAMLYYQLDEKPVAVELARKSVVVSERTLGIDSSETILSYLNLGLFEHANGNTTAALAYIRHAFGFWRIVFGDGHPDSVTTMNNVAVMLQALKHYHDSRLWFETSLKVCEDIFGKSSANSATLSFQLAQALALDQDSKGAVTKMRDAYNVFLAELGPEDRNTKEAESWLDQLTHNAVSIAKQAKERRKRIPLTPRVTMAAKPQPQAGQGKVQPGAFAESTTSGPAVTGGSAEGLDNRSIDELMKFIEGSADQGGKKRRGNANPKRRGAKA